MSVSSIGGSATSYVSRLSQASVRGSQATGGPPPIPDELKSKFESIIKGGGSQEDIKASLDQVFADFKNSDTFQSLPQSVRDQLEKGPPQGPPSADQAKQLLQQLGQTGEHTRFRLSTQSSDGGAESDLQASLLKLMGEIGKDD